METLSNYLDFRLQQVDKERHQIIEKIKGLAHTQSISPKVAINSAPSYRVISTWLERIKFILQQEHRRQNRPHESGEKPEI